MGARFHLVCGGHRYPLLVGDWLLGRSPNAGITVADTLASREHAVLRVRDDQVAVADLGSRNGTFVNAQRLEGSAPLRAGDILRIGDTHYTLEESAPDELDGETPLERGDPTLVPLVRRRGAPADIGEVTHVPEPNGRTATPPVRQVDLRSETLIAPRTALLVLGDAEWAEQIQRAAAIHPNLRVVISEPAFAGTALHEIEAGILLLDLDAAASLVEAILTAWQTPPSRGPVLLTAQRPEHEGVVLAREKKVDGYLRAGKASILVVAQLRYHLQRVTVTEAGPDTADA